MLLHVSRNPDDGKTAIALWMVRTRKDLGATVEAIAKEADYSVSALRKVEGGSNPKPSRGLVNAVFRVFRRLGAEKGIAVLEPPGTNETATPEGMAALVAGIERAIDRQTHAIVAAIQSRDRTLSDLLTELGSYRKSQIAFLEAMQGEPATHVPKPTDDPAPEPRGPVATRARRA
jgi:hypothetical protein